MTWKNSKNLHEFSKRVWYNRCDVGHHELIRKMVVGHVVETMNYGKNDVENTLNPMKIQVAYAIKYIMSFLSCQSYSTIKVWMTHAKIAYSTLCPK